MLLFPYAIWLIPALSLAAEDKPLPAGVHSYQGKLYVSGAPVSDAFPKMAAAGVKTAIDLREPEEQKGSAEADAKKNGMRYYSSPIARTGDFQAAQLAAVEKIVQKNKERKIWVFCQSGSRASAWLAVHLAKAHGLPAENAMAEARKAGLEKEEMITKVRKFLHEK